MRRALDRVAAALAGHSEGVLEHLVGEPCFGPPREIAAAFDADVARASSGYGPPAGLDSLRGVLADRLDREGRTERLMLTHGAKGGLLVVLAGLVEPGDEVIHPVPCYPAYPAMVRRFGGVPIGVAEGGDGFAGWADAVTAVMSPRTRAVVLSSPSNPSGSVIDAAELDVLVAACGGRGVRLLLDEAYRHFVFDGAGAAGPVTDDDGAVIRIGSASKSLALCGWRLGWIVADSDLISRFTAVQTGLLNPPATPPQRALLALPEVPESYFEANSRDVRTRLDGLAEALRGAGFDAASPTGGFYLWLDVRDRLDGAAPNTATWCERLAAERAVGLWPGEDFGAPGFVRLALPRGDLWRDDLAELTHRLSSRS